MNPYKLGTRLQALYDLVDVQDKEFYDLCCDHGHVGINIALLKQPVNTILNDQIKGICENLESKVADIPLGVKLEIVNEDASQIKLNINNRKSILVAGIGGPLLLRILDNLLPQLTLNDELILSPHTKIHEVRKKISDLNLNLICEKYVYEAGKHYEILKLSYSDVYQKVSLVGNEIWQDLDTNSNLQTYHKNLIEYYTRKTGYDENQFFKLILSDLNTLNSRYK